MNDALKSDSDRPLALVYMPQLDGLRAFAVVAVLIHHYTVDGWATGATMGVRLFFVLSGFLITGILLRARDVSTAQGSSRGRSLFHFYVRRALRIFPLYYFVIAVALVFDADYAREYIPWLATYTLNLKMVEQDWFIANFAHFWTLAVEEQFYIFWPWFVLLVPQRWLLWVASAMFAIGPLYRLYCVLGWMFFGSEISGLATYISTLACLDTLGMGALLAILVHSSRSPALLRRMLSGVALPLGIAIYGALYVLQNWYDRWEFTTVLSDVALALCFSWLIYSAAIGFRGPVGAILQFRPLCYVGKISYGIYVYHAFMPSLLLYLFSLAEWPYPQTQWVGFVIATAATLLTASLSWHLLEGPINGLKRHFKMHPAQSDGAEPGNLAAHAEVVRYRNA